MNEEQKSDNESHYELEENEDIFPENPNGAVLMVRKEQVATFYILTNAKLDDAPSKLQIFAG